MHGTWCGQYLIQTLSVDGPTNSLTLISIAVAKLVYAYSVPLIRTHHMYAINQHETEGEDTYE